MSKAIEARLKAEELFARCTLCGWTITAHDRLDAEVRAEEHLNEEHGDADWDAENPPVRGVKFYDWQNTEEVHEDGD